MVNSVASYHTISYLMISLHRRDVSEPAHMVGNCGKASYHGWKLIQESYSVKAHDGAFKPLEWVQFP